MTCQGRSCTNETPIDQRNGEPRKWCSEKCRKTKYSVPCVDCGYPLNGSDGRGENAAMRCNQCASIKSGDERKIWTPQAVVLAMQEWAAEYGEPPSSHDWDSWHAEHVLHDPARADRFRSADGRWPTLTSVCRAWGSWNAAIEAAGFAPRLPHGGGENVQRRRSQRAKATA